MDVVDPETGEKKSHKRKTPLKNKRVGELAAMERIIVTGRDQDDSHELVYYRKCLKQKPADFHKRLAFLRNAELKAVEKAEAADTAGAAPSGSPFGVELLGEGGERLGSVAEDLGAELKLVLEYRRLRPRFLAWCRTQPDFDTGLIEA